MQRIGRRRGAGSPLVGVISDARSLGQAMLIIPVAVLVGGLIWTYAAWLESRSPATIVA